MGPQTLGADASAGVKNESAGGDARVPAQDLLVGDLQ